MRADPPRRVQQDDVFGSFESQVERLEVVAVGDPGIAPEKVALPLPPLDLRRLDPARSPVVAVEVNHRKAGPRRQRSREGALAGTGWADDEDPTANDTDCALHHLGVSERLNG